MVIITDYYYWQYGNDDDADDNINNNNYDDYDYIGSNVDEVSDDHHDVDKDNFGKDMIIKMMMIIILIRVGKKISNLLVFKFPNTRTNST